MDQLLDEILRTILEILESGDELPDEIIDQVMMILQERIQSLSSSQPVESSQPIDQSQIPNAPHESSNVNGFKYSPKTGELLVQFHGPYPQAAGSVYKYENVPQFIYDIFSRGGVGPKTSGANSYHRWQKNITPSLGGALNALLKNGKFKYSKLS
jgi:hypothetical protein